jgi:RNA-directed DNA polymerase
VASSDFLRSVETPSDVGAVARHGQRRPRIVPASAGFDFLGVHFRKQQTPRGRQFCYCWASRRSMQRIRDKVRILIGRETRVQLSEKTARLNPVLRGWGAYFSWLDATRHFRLIDKYVECKLRRWLRDKHQRRHRAFWRTPRACWQKAGLYVLTLTPFPGNRF